MEIGVHHFQNIKFGVHIGQAIIMFISWALCIAVFRSNASVDGRLGWYFGLCFLTIPALIYQTMTPRFPRTRKFANPYAIAGTDLAFAILWLSAFAAVANWNGTGECKSGCSLSKSIVAIGVFLWLSWVLTTAMSIYGCIYFRREGYLPGASRAPHNASMIDPDKEAFSTAPHDEYAPVHDTDEHEAESSYAGAHGNQTFGGGERYDMNLPSYGASGNGGGSGLAYVSPQVHDENTGYGGAYGGGGGLHPQVGGRVQFPEARYDNV